MDGTLPAATTETWPDHFSVNLNNGEVCNDERMPECADWWSAPTTPAFFLLPAPDRAIGATTKALTRTVVMTNITGLHLSPLLTSTAPLLDAAAIKAAATESIVNLPNPGFESSGSWNQGPLSLFPATAFYRNWFDAPAGRTHTGDSDGQHYGYSISNHGYGYLFSDAIAVSANTQYDLYVYLRGQLDSDDSFSGWYIESYFYNSSGSYIGVQVVDSGFALGTNWSQEGGRFTTPAGTASTRILLLNYFTTGWLAFDDVSLIRVGTSTNLAPNPSFETTSGWTEVGSSLFPGASFFRSTGAIAAPRSGSYAYALSNLAYGVLSSPQFAVSGGQTYWVSAYVRGEADGDAGYTTAWIGVRYFDSSGAYLGLGTIAFPTPTNSWQYVEGTVTPPANAATMYVDLEFYYASGWVAFDEVAVRRASNNTLVYSSGFETSGEWGEWKPTQFPGTSFFRGTGAIATPYSGSYALAISNHAYGALTSPALAITAGQAYEVTAYGRGMLDAEDSAGAVWLGIRYYNSSGGYLGYGTAQLIDPSAITTSWQRFGGVVIPPSGATSMILDLESYYNSGWVTFDDVAVGEVTKYYYAGSQRIAMRQGNALYWLLGDHLGSTAYTVNGTTETGETRYYPWGKDRFTSGQTLTSYKFTGQREEAGLGLYYYGARWYDPALGRFIQPDTIVPNPGDVQSFDRYAYVNNNPLKYIDPTGHWSEDQLNEVLGNNWQFRYFGDLAPYKGAFAGNDKLLQFLTSSETTNMFDLRMVGVAMGVGEFMSTLVGNTPDAIAIRGNFGAGAIIGVGNSFEAVVNFRSSELSYFWSPGASGGAIGGAGGDIGISIINDLPSNTAYRGYFGAVKADFKYGAGGTVEGFLGLPLPNFPDGDIFAGANGAFLGVGLGGELDLSAGFSYAFEALRVNTNGRDWGPNWRNYHPVADAGEIFYQAYWGLGLLIYGDSWISANND